jgi:hypothetical protein
MRRSLASLLLVLLVGALALPFLQAEQTVPACCRRGGQHHCAMASHDDGVGFVAARCPCQHCTPLISVSITAARSGRHSPTSVAQWPQASPIDAPMTAQLAADSCQKRGPPRA